MKNFNKKILFLFIIMVLTFTGCRTTPDIYVSSISDAYIDESGELVLVYSDGNKDNLGNVVGKDGEDGEDGADGKDGESADNITQATSMGLRSTVSVICKFTGPEKTPDGGVYKGEDSKGTQNYYSFGAGVIYELDKAQGDAFIITNYHVVHDASSFAEGGISDEIRVYLYGGEISGREIAAEYVGGSEYYDIAVLRVNDSENLKNSCAEAAKLADSDKTMLGETAIAIGNPNGEGMSVSYGIVSVDSEYIDIKSSEGTTLSFRVVRVDAAVNSGNSGGGLYNAAGELMGIVNAKLIDSTVENIGYAIPSNVARAVADNIIDNCFGTNIKSVQRGMLGITVQVTDSYAEYEAESGRVQIYEKLVIQEVSSGSVSEGKLMAGDIIKAVSLHGESSMITRQYKLIDLLLDVRVGDVVTLNVIRDGNEISVDILMTEKSITAY